MWHELKYEFGSTPQSLLHRLVSGTCGRIQCVIRVHENKLVLFVFRAAKKLSVSCRKRQTVPAPLPVESPGPLLYTEGFSRALQLSPPAVPPRLLRARSKVKDKLELGKVSLYPECCALLSSSSVLVDLVSAADNLTKTHILTSRLRPNINNQSYQ